MERTPILISVLLTYEGITRRVRTRRVCVASRFFLPLNCIVLVKARRFEPHRLDSTSEQ